MRKATIIKYEKEFLAWCKGDSVLLGAPTSMHDKALIWREVRDFSDWKPLDTVYVLNDSYSDYRKAGAEGKIVEFKHPQVGYDEWEIVTPEHLFQSIVSGREYRIKPEEFKFKVGDWVKILTFRNHVPVTIKNIEGCRYVLSTGLYADDAILELWQPKPGEFCWYSKWDKIVCVEFYLCKYVLDMNEVEPEYKHKYEPFIGQLPTYLRK